MIMQARYVSIAECVDVRGTAVVLDVIRAFTTAAWAFELGTERIILSDDLDEALAIKERFPGSLALKDSQPMPGFELSNSPLELRDHDLRGKTIVQRTTHGTMGAVAAQRAGAERLYCGSFLVARATAAAIRASGAGETCFVITGEGGAGDEDRACAEYIAALIDDPDTDVAPYIARVALSNAARLVNSRAAEGRPGVQKGDVEATMDANRFDFVMEAREEDGLLVLRAYNRDDD
jgi:2-phosphosulfolactate phosphatase